MRQLCLHEDLVPATFLETLGKGPATEMSKASHRRRDFEDVLI